MSVIIDGSAGVTTNSGAVYNSIQSGTAVASTSGTSITFTGIPSWVKRITVMFSGVSTSGTSGFQIQLGSGSLTTSGYYSISTNIGGFTPQMLTSASGLVINSNAAANTFYGQMILTNVSGNIWVESHAGLNSVSSLTLNTGGGGITLAGILDRVAVTTVNGTDTFDAGSINILYE